VTVDRVLKPPTGVGGGWVKFTQVMAYGNFSIPLIAGVTKHFTGLPLVPRKVDRGLPSPRGRWRKEI
jgi:hypothetical protein